MTKLVDMINIAYNVPYYKPYSQNTDEWTSDELLYESINIALVNGVQIKAALNICQSFPPLKLIYKSIMTRYITHFTALHNEKIQHQQLQVNTC